MEKEVLREVVRGTNLVEVWGEFERGYTFVLKEGCEFLEKNSGEVQLAIRYLSDKGKAGLYYVNGFSKELLDQALERARALSFFGKESVFPEKTDQYPSIEPPSLKLPEVKDIKEWVEKIKDAVLSQKGITKIDKLSIKVSEVELNLLRGDLELSWRQPYFSFVISVVAKERGNEATAYEWWQGAIFPLEEVLERSILACKKALALCRAKKGKSRKLAILFPPHAGIELLQVLEFSFLGEEVVKGRSFLKDKLGKKFFSEEVTIIDDGLKQGLPETRPFDDEGVPQTTKVLLEKGEVKSFLWDSYWGKKAGEASTGNARRGSISSHPSVSSTNLFIKEGSYDKTELIKEYPLVFEVIEILGAHTADPISGTFSVGLSGILYENGEEADYYKEAGFSGNIFDIFKRVSKVGSDLKFYGEYGSPSLLVEDMEIG
ncbi:MAG: TldD/PmbA family protein [Thermodesulfobacteria bacterium]|nr:TldD/PmbA family protein [Thermodesulfobacteriota bacterium]